MKIEIKKGRQYLLDGKDSVTVIKPVNRAETLFSVEIPGKGIIMVEKNRLTETQQS